MRIKDWIYKQIIPKEDEIQNIISELENSENLTKEKCIEFLKQVLVSTENTYKEAVNDTLYFVEQVDRNFLNNNIPSHIK